MELSIIVGKVEFGDVDAFEFFENVIVIQISVVFEVENAEVFEKVEGIRQGADVVVLEV